ncbi:hypothetical protein MMC14_009069 [Varicellaria rhodocarpa]|nr:hypothetical protein [Varicellaria rhodocarpa]
MADSASAIHIPISLEKKSMDHSAETKTPTSVVVTPPTHGRFQTWMVLLCDFLEVLVTDLVPLRERGEWFGYFGMVWALGTVTGPIIGGAFAQKVSWRWIFWINLPFSGIGFVTVPIFLPGQDRLDCGFLLTASVTSFLVSVSWGGVVFAWSSWHTLVPLILGFFGIVAFIVYENHFAGSPLIPLRIFKQRTAMVTYFGTVIHGIILWCLLYYLPLYYEAVKDYSPILAGIAVFPETFTVSPASVVSGWLLTVLGMGLLYILSPGTSVPGWIFLNLIPGLGTGLLFPSMACALQAAAEAKDAAFAAAKFNFMRAIGQSIGGCYGRASTYSKDASSLVQILKAMPEGSPERIMIVNAYAESLKVVWATMAGLAFVAMVCSARVEGLSMDGGLSTEQGLRHTGKSGSENEGTIDHGAINTNVV